MNRILFFLAVLIFNNGTYAKCSGIAQSVKDDYATGMFEAFISQSYGKSTIASYQFDVAREKAKKAGENVLNLIAIEKLFTWYRMYASSLRLYHKEPTGRERIIGEYRPSFSKALSSFPRYESEWGNSPEQARIIREFMFGVGEVIAGVFCASVSSGLLANISVGVATEGASRIYTSLNSLWAAIAKIGGTAPENIPPAEHIKKVEKRLKRTKPKLMLDDRDSGLLSPKFSLNQD
jgi:hypothetical protein